MIACGVRPIHRDGDACSLVAGHAGRHSWDQRHRAKWPREAVIDAIRRWADIYGYGPRYEHWHTASGEPHPDFMAVGKGAVGLYPASITVKRVLGVRRWRDALAIAGVEPPPHLHALPRKTQPCPVCGNSFETYEGERKATCSAKCGAIWSGRRHRGRQQRVLALNAQGKTNRQIAKLLDMPSQSVANILSRARARGIQVRTPYWERGRR